MQSASRYVCFPYLILESEDDGSTPQMIWTYFQGGKPDGILEMSGYARDRPYSGDGNDMNPALPDTSMKLGRYVYKHELFEIFSLANQNYSNFQDGGSKFQDGCQNKY